MSRDREILVDMTESELECVVRILGSMNERKSLERLNELKKYHVYEQRRRGCFV